MSLRSFPQALAFLTALILTSSCFHPARPPKSASSSPSIPAIEARRRIVAAAREKLGRRYKDCSTFVRSVLHEAGIELRPATGKVRSDSEAIYKVVLPVREPEPGDLAFFHNSYDRDHDGANDDAFSHVAIVESVDGPRIALIHRARAGIIRIRMDLSHPNDDAKNDNLRVKLPSDPKNTHYLASQLLVGFGSAL